MSIKTKATQSVYKKTLPYDEEIVRIFTIENKNAIDTLEVTLFSEPD